MGFLIPMTNLKVAMPPLLLLLFLVASASAAEKPPGTEPKPDARVTEFHTYDLFQEGPQASTESSAADKPSSAAMHGSEYAVCKPTAGAACANKRIQCPAACVNSFYASGDGEGVHHSLYNPPPYDYGDYGEGGGGGYGPKLFACSYTCSGGCTATCSSA